MKGEWIMLRLSAFRLAEALNNFFLEILQEGFFLGEVHDVLDSMREYNESEKLVVRKTPEELVSAVDIAIQNKFRDFVHTNGIIQNYPVISEEDCDAWPPKHDAYWVIDPLDGTHPFLMGFPNFGISVFLVEYGMVTFTSAFLPTERCLERSGIYYAGLNEGAWRYPLFYGKPARLSASLTEHIEDATLLIDGPTKHRTKLMYSEFGQNLIPKVRKWYHCFSGPVWGSTRVAAANIFPNFADLYLNVKSKPWDNLPAALLVEEAGGVAVNLNGVPYSLTNYETLLYGNRVLVEKALKVGVNV